MPIVGLDLDGDKIRSLVVRLFYFSLWRKQQSRGAKGAKITAMANQPINKSLLAVSHAPLPC